MDLSLMAVGPSYLLAALYGVQKWCERLGRAFFHILSQTICLCRPQLRSY